MLASTPEVEYFGTMACSPFAPVLGAMLKLNAVPFHAKLPKEELLRASSQFNI
jgi:hypothetical protein